MKAQTASVISRPRPFVVKEIITAMSWSGTVWAVSCATRESAIRAFERRVSRNFLENGEVGAVMVFDRRARRLIVWTSDINNPVAAAKYWCP